MTITVAYSHALGRAPASPSWRDAELQMSDGNFIATGNIAGGGISYVIRTATGEVAGGGTVGTPTEANPDGAGLKGSGGGFVIVDEQAVSPDNHDIQVHIRTPAGAVVADFAVDSGASNDTAPHVAALDDGGFAVTWQRNSGSAAELWYAVYEANGTLRTAPTLLADGPYTDPAITSLASGGFAIAGDGGMVAILDSHGNLLHVPVTGDAGFDAAITILPNGYIFTTYTMPFFAEVHGSVIDPDTGTVLDVQVIASPPDPPGYSFVYNAWDSAVWRDVDGDVSVSYRYYMQWEVQIPGGDFETWQEEGHPTSQYDLIRTTAGDSAADTTAGDTLIDVVLGGAGNDLLDGRGGNDTLQGGPGADTLIGATGNDVYVIDTDDTVIENADEGIDAVWFPASYSLGSNLEALVLLGADFAVGSGNALDNTIVGNDGSNILFGYAGNDTLDGRGGAHAMAGGTGNDFYLVDDHNDLALEALTEGTDTVQSSAAFFTLGPNVEILNLAGYGSIAGTGNELSNIVSGNSANNVLAGLGGADTLIGGLGPTFLGDSDLLYGGGGNDRLYGGWGSDRMDGGAGGDRMYGGDDLDTVDYSASPSGVTVRLQSGQGSGGDATGDILEGIENLIGSSYDDVLAGDAGNNRLDGNTGSDLLHGGASIDTVDGGAGKDILYGDSANDRLYGDSGNDTIYGGSGYDRMYGGIGNDLFYFDDAYDSAYENAGEGFDRIYTAASVALPANVEQLYASAGATAVRLVGNDLANEIRGGAVSDTLEGGLGNDTLYGDRGNDTLDGGNGIDRLYGGVGNDFFYFDGIYDRAYENPGEGSDRIYTAIDLRLPANIEQLYASAGAPELRLIGNELANDIRGGDGNDSLYGGLGDDALYGGMGNDWLWSGPGIDVMRGGIGDDVYIVDDAGDVVSEYLDQGVDTVRSSVSYSLPNPVENLQLIGAGDSNGTGNGLANTLLGTTGSNVLDGRAGADLMRGAAGDDTYIVDNAGDVIVDGFNQGLDTVHARIDFALSNNLETLALTGAGSIAGTGNALANLLLGNTGNNALDGGAGSDTLLGNAGNDTLYGGTGDDTLTGGAGADRLIGGVGNDIFRFELASDSGTTATMRDLIADFVQGQDHIDFTPIANLTFIGSTPFSLTPNELRQYAAGANVVLAGDLDGNGVADFEVMVAGSHAFDTSDFVT